MSDTGTAAARHVPVLRDRIVELLGPALTRPGAEPAVYVDATLGHGGHALAVALAYPGVRIVGIDRDPHALDLARERLAGLGERVTLVRAVYDDLADVLDDLGLDHVDAVLFDLGVSSMQLDDLDRGFAYRADAPLDMRMDPSTGLTAADVLNTYASDDLERVLREYGEERFARRIARAIVARRRREPFTRSAALVDLLRDAIPAASQRAGGHPAKRTFQALRIEVNDELATWRRALDVALDALPVGGRIAVLSYHSLEDRLAKTAFVRGARSRAPVDLPIEPAQDAPWLALVTRGAERPSATEILDNPRAASARLRVAERTRPLSPSSSAVAAARERTGLDAGRRPGRPSSRRPTGTAAKGPRR